MKVLFKLVFLFSFLVILFGFYELKHEQDIFAQSKQYCCNNGMCTYPNITCSSSSGIKFKPKCNNDYTFTCMDCVDYSYAGQVCNDPKNSCRDHLDRCYGWCYYNGSWQWLMSK